LNLTLDERVIQIYNKLKEYDFMKKLLVLLFISFILPSQVFSWQRQILQHANESNGQITIEQISAYGFTNGWYVFHFGGSPVATRSQVQIWANNRREYFRTNFRNYASQLNSSWDMQFRWYFTIMNATGEILDSGFLSDNRQIVWDDESHFLSPAEMLEISFTEYLLDHRWGTLFNIFTFDGTIDNKRDLVQRWINTKKRNTVAGIGNGWVADNIRIYIRDKSTGFITDIGITTDIINGVTSDLVAPILWFENNRY